MRKMIYFEFKKILNKKIFLIFSVIITLNITNIYMINHPIGNSDFYKGKREIVKQVEGVITQEKVDFLSTSLQRHKKQVEEGKFESDKPDPNTYTGYIYGDMNAFQEVYDELYQMYNYAEVTKNKVSILNENIEISGNEKKSTYIKNKIDDRQITMYYDTLGINEYLNYSNSTLLVFIFIVLLASNYLYYDKENEMDTIINTTIKGRKKIKRSQFLTLTYSIFIVVLIVSIIDFLCFNQIYRIRGLGNWIFSIENFGLTFLNIRIISYIIYQFVIKVMISLILGQLVIYFSRKFKNTFKTISLSLIVSLFFWNLFYSVNSLTSLIALGRAFHTIRFSGYHIQALTVLSVCFFILLFTGNIMNREKI